MAMQHRVSGSGPARHVLSAGQEDSRHPLGVHPLNEEVSVVVGGPIHRAGAYILDRFLANQKEIQRRCPSAELVLATVEHDFADELDAMLGSLGVRGRVLRYTTVKPPHARSRTWNIACGREAIREYMVSQTDAKYLLCVDGDMTYDPAIVEVMEREIEGHEAVFSGYVTKMYHKWGGLALVGGACCMLTRGVAEKLRFRCIEFKNGHCLFEDTLLEFDLMRARARIRKGFFLSTSHYRSETVSRHLSPRRVGTLRRMANTTVVRYALIWSSLVLRRHVAWDLKRVVRALLNAVGDKP